MDIKKGEDSRVRIDNFNEICKFLWKLKETLIKNNYHRLSFDSFLLSEDSMTRNIDILESYCAENKEDKKISRYAISLLTK